ncbi:MAG: GNAT family N-acetyltransferase [Acidobacteria bacterium]|nr:GNAT family N-acetyltransferase [Acidobacteriota bacterium]
MRTALWPETDDAHLDEIARYFAGTLNEPLAVLLACDNDGTPLGFIELNLRKYAEGCETDRIGYVEGWYVEPHVRRRGIGRALFAAGETWARAQGCTEMASDTELNNEVSFAAHRALGYEETDRIICFRKEL